MKVEFTRRASIQLAAILDYLDERNPQAATRLVGRIEAALRVIGEHPEMGRRQDEAGIRKYVVLPAAYLLFYSVDSDAGRIRILFVTHPAQRRPYEDL